MNPAVHDETSAPADVRRGRFWLSVAVSLGIVCAQPTGTRALAISSVTVGDAHTCAVTATGGVKCWGHGRDLGRNNDIGSSMAGAVLGLSSGVIAVDAGFRLTCAVAAAGGLKCWGNGILGNGSTNTTSLKPCDVLGLTSGVAAVSVGPIHACAVTTAGGVKCWGNNAFGQLGDGTTNFALSPVDVSGLANAVAVTVGDSHTCALTSAGGIKCWGDDTDGALGNGSFMSSSVPIDVPGLTSGIAEVTAGAHYTCARTTAGGAKCWGNNAYGQLGDGTMTQSSVPVDVSGLTSGVAHVSAGSTHTCAVTISGGVKCWGNGAVIGDGTGVDSDVPVDVSGLTSGAASVSAGAGHTCVVTTTNALKCWGANNEGQLGDGRAVGSFVPIEVVGLQSGMGAVDAGGYSGCAVTTGGGVQCWGQNKYGELGDGTMDNTRGTPVDVSGLSSGVARVSMGSFYHACALTTAGGVKCWGFNEWGQLGDGSFTSSAVPVDVSGLTSGVLAIGAGSEYSCALTASGGVKCWGLNLLGELGDGTTTQSNVPVDVTGLTSGIAAIGIGGHHACAVLTGGGVRCWGYGQFGQLGNGSTSNSTVPVDVTGLIGAAAVSAGFNHTCALTTAGGVQCWGLNAEGELGNGKILDSAVPVQVSGLTSGVASVSAGYVETCVITTTAGIKCWGDNGAGQGGDGTSAQRHKPTDVFGALSGMATVRVGLSHTCALTASGAVRCWGQNTYGALGIGGTDDAPTPIDVLLPGSRCPPMPVLGCRTATATVMSAVEKNGKRSTTWKWKHGQATNEAEFGAPTAASRFALCVYDSGGLAFQLAEVGWNCTKKSECWKLVSTKGFHFANAQPNPQSVTLLGSDVNEARITLSDSRASIASPALPLTAPVTVQLRSTRSNTCWGVTYTSGDIATTAANKFKAKTGS